MKEIDDIKAALAAGPTPGPWPLIRACNPAAMQKIIEHIDAQQSEIERLREALKFYAEGDHFIFDRDEWDTVSGEPQNFWCDEAGTATVEDGTIAKLMLAAMKETP